MSTKTRQISDANPIPVFGSSTSGSLLLMSAFLPDRKQSHLGSLGFHCPKAATPRRVIANQKREAAKPEISYGCLFSSDEKTDGKDQTRYCEELASESGRLEWMQNGWKEHWGKKGSVRRLEWSHLQRRCCGQLVVASAEAGPVAGGSFLKDGSSSKCQ